MRVRRLDLFGFKSFAIKTAVHFEPGVTAIVGPNGSGKSNIVDGIRWVLGEHNPRDVRAPRLEDIIFNGTDTKAPLSMAEVSLTIENERGLLPISFSEVQVTRRLYRSGESECFINQSPCRLKDIQELFLGTGLGGGTYAIIEQGHIDMILSSKPEERRVVFEEASGIAKYLTKKQETLRRLDEVEQNLVRVADIIQEVKRQMSALERQANKARQYKAAWEQLKTLEVQLAADELRRGELGRQELAGRLEELTRKRAGLDEERQRLLGSLERCNSAVTETQGRLEGLRAQLAACISQIEQHQTQIGLKQRWVEEVAQQHRQLAAEQAQLEERAGQLANQREQWRAQEQTLDGQRTETDGQRAGVSEELQRTDQAIAETRRKLEQCKGEFFGLASEATRHRNLLAEINAKLQTVAAQRVRFQDQQQRVQQRLASFSSKQQEFVGEQQRLGAEREALQSQLAAARQSAGQAQNAHRELVGRLSGLRERSLGQRARVQLLEEVWRRYEGFPESVKALVAHPPEGMLGVLVDLLDCEPGYELALEAALGPLAAALVVQDRPALLRCRERLAQLQLEGAQFIVLADCPLASAGGPAFAPTTPSHEGFVGWLAASIRPQAALQSAAQWLLGSWGAIEEIGPLLSRMPAPLGNWVSKAGDRWDGQSWQFWGGGITGRVGRKRQWEQAYEELAGLDRELGVVQAAVQEAEERWRRLTAEEERVRQQVEQLVPTLNKLEAQLALAEHESSQAGEELRSNELAAAELSNQERELTERQAQAAQATAQAQARQEELDAALKQLQAESDSAAQAKAQRLMSAAQLDAALRSIGERQAETRARIAELEQEAASLGAQHQQKLAQVQEQAAKTAELAAQLEEHHRQVPQLGETQGRLQAEIDGLTQQLRQQEQQRDQIVPGVLAVEQELLVLSQALREREQEWSERAFRRSRVLERLRDMYHLDEAQALADPAAQTTLSDENRQAAAAQVEKLRAKSDASGPVSLGSVEEYDELAKRYGFLQAQQQDLLKAQEDLRHSIQQINRTARVQFRETFTRIQQEFQHYFTELFGGGQADLILMDDQDVLECGIDIVARPPGKRPQSISLLSGGERALTATALLFALFKVRPSPFCILDEIDAPLDEANVDRFTRVLEEFLSLSQFILITHNKKTITKADSIYGVTMEQPGMSKIVSVKFSKSKTDTATAIVPPAPAASDEPKPADPAPTPSALASSASE
ncbi:MAG: chromosome segregation protein SMC [Candidatus Omnitrophica bacterium]|nr:chromosome segregation protein SMC [Candidatus Omnitrophota bacterium]